MPGSQKQSVILLPLPPGLRTFPLGCCPQPSHTHALHACPPIRPSVCLLLTSVSTPCGPGWPREGRGGRAGSSLRRPEWTSGLVQGQPPAQGPAQPRGSRQPSLHASVFRAGWAGPASRAAEGRRGLVSRSVHGQRAKAAPGEGGGGRRAVPPAPGPGRPPHSSAAAPPAGPWPLRAACPPPCCRPPQRPRPCPVRLAGCSSPASRPSGSFVCLSFSPSLPSSFSPFSFFLFFLLSSVLCTQAAH